MDSFEWGPLYGFTPFRCISTLVERKKRRKLFTLRMSKVVYTRMIPFS